MGLKDPVYHTNAFMLKSITLIMKMGNVIEILNDDKKPASEKFWELEKRIKEDKRHPGVIMEMSKSEVIWDIVRLIRLKVIAYDDLSDFRDELQLEVKRILEMSR